MNAWLRVAPLLTAALTLAACDGLTPSSLSGPAAGADARPLQALVLPLGQPVPLDNGSHLTFTRIDTDSRCPAGAPCWWEGEARARFTVRTAGDTLYAFPLVIPGGSPQQLPPERVQPAAANGRLVRLVRLQPYPGYPPEDGMEPTATVLVEPCPHRCPEVWPPPIDQ